MFWSIYWSAHYNIWNSPRFRWYKRGNSGGILTQLGKGRFMIFGKKAVCSKWCFSKILVGTEYIRVGARGFYVLPTETSQRAYPQVRSQSAPPFFFFLALELNWAVGKWNSFSFFWTRQHNNTFFFLCKIINKFYITLIAKQALIFIEKLFVQSM